MPLYQELVRDLVPFAANKHGERACIADLDSAARQLHPAGTFKTVEHAANDLARRAEIRGERLLSRSDAMIRAH